MPTPLNAIDQVLSDKLLGVNLNSNVEFNDHVEVSSCSQKTVFIEIDSKSGSGQRYYDFDMQ